MSTPKAPFDLPKRRFSKKALNGIILIVAVLIFVLSQTNKRSENTATNPDQTTQTTGDSAAVTENASSVTENASSATQAGEALRALRDKIKATPGDGVSLDIKHLTLANGAKLFFVAAPDLPMINMELIFDAGAARDGDSPGLARLTSSLIGEGSEAYSVDEIARGFESLGSEFTTASERDMGVVKLKSLSAPEHLEPSLALFINVISQPTFPESAFERIRKTMLLSLEREKASPRRLIGKATWSALYPNHPYANHPGGTPESLAQITRSALQQFHQKHYTAANAVIAIVGAIDWSQAQDIANRITQALPQGKALPPLPKATVPDTLNPIHIDYPSQQTHIRIATLSLTRQSDDLIPLRLANEVLGGGGFTSELNKVIRQEHGLAYSVYSYASAMRSRGIFLIDLQTQNDSAVKALRLTQNTLSQFIKSGASTQALAQAKSHIVASFPLGFGTNSNLLGQIGNLGFYELPLDYFDQYIPKILDTDAKTAKKIFNRTIGAQNHLVVTLGPTPITAEPPAEQ